MGGIGEEADTMMIKRKTANIAGLAVRVAHAVLHATQHERDAMTVTISTQGAEMSLQIEEVLIRNTEAEATKYCHRKTAPEDQGKGLRHKSRERTKALYLRRLQPFKAIRIQVH